jgi:hypothetical protein
MTPKKEALRVSEAPPLRTEPTTKDYTADLGCVKSGLEKTSSEIVQLSPTGPVNTTVPSAGFAEGDTDSGEAVLCGVEKDCAASESWILTPEGQEDFERWCEEKPTKRGTRAEATGPTTPVLVSLLPSVFRKETTHPVTPEGIISRIRSDEFAEPIETIRQKYAEVLTATGDPEAAKTAIKPMKERLPAVMVGGEFISASAPVADKLVKHSQLFCADLDQLGEKLHETRVALLDSKHLWAVFLSPSGDGLKAVFRVPAATPLQHKRCLFPAVQAHVRNLTALEIDKACSDVGRLCFLSYDPDASINDSAAELPVDLAIEDEPKTEKGRGIKPSKEQVRSMLEVLPIGKGRARPDYDTWLRVIGAVQDALPESDALEVLQEWSPAEAEGEYEAKFESSLNKLTVGTLYHMALENGWKMPYEPPPLDLLPGYLQEHVRVEADAANVDVSFILLPMLSSLGAAIGNSRSVMLKPGWAEPPVVWTCIIAGSGQGKSPALKAATYLHAEMEKSFDAQNEAAMRTFEDEKASWVAQGRKKSGAEPAKPAFRTCLMSDLTLEALATRLKDNRRGVLVEKDELSQWFASFDQYHDGKGSDVSKWLSLHSGTRIAVDRKGSTPIRVPNPRVCLTGGIQPGVLKRALTHEFFERGLPARFISAAPPKRKRGWHEKGITEARRYEVYESLLPLWSLQPDEGGPGLLMLSREARAVFAAFYDECAEQQEHIESERGTAFLSKLPAQAARFALIGQLARDHAVEMIQGCVMESACDLARWAARETQRIYATLAETKEQRQERELITFIRKKGGVVSVRDLLSGPRHYRGNKEKAEAALEELVGQGVAERFEDRPERGPAGVKYRLLVARSKRE